MQYDVTLLRKRGMRLRPSELEPPVRGQLIVRQDDGRATSIKRPFTAAHLKKPAVAQMMSDALTPLHDVRLISLDNGVLVLQGLELFQGESERVYEVSQIWRCVPVTEAPARG